MSPAEVGRTEVVLGALLAAAAGSVDAMAFMRLGNAFASIATGNIVVAGVSIGRADWTALIHSAVAVGAYAAGVAVGAATAGRNASPGPWSGRATRTGGLELVLVGALAGLWWSAGGSPTGAVQYGALATAGLAMGVQSAAFQLVRLPGVTTTYFTGTLTGLLAGLVKDRRLNGPAAIATLSLLAGAVVAAELVVRAADAAMAVPLVMVAAVLVVGARRTHQLE